MRDVHYPGGRCIIRTGAVSVKIVVLICGAHLVLPGRERYEHTRLMRQAFFLNHELTKINTNIYFVVIARRQCRPGNLVIAGLLRYARNDEWVNFLFQQI